MNVFILIPIFFIFLGVRTCQNPNLDKKRSLETQKFKIESGDSIFYFTKNSSGALLESFLLVRNKPEGLWSRMYSNGKLRQLITYKDGLRNGWLIEHDSLGLIEKKIHYKRDSVLGHALFYTKGKLDLYNSFDFDGGSICVVKYQDGRFLSYQGRTIGMDYQISDSSVSIVYAAPPEFETKIDVSNKIKIDTLNGVINVPKSLIYRSDSILITCTWYYDSKILNQSVAVVK